MVETLSQITREIQKIASYTSVMSRYALTYSTVFKKLNMFTPMVREYNKQLLQGEASLVTGFDNFQLFLSIKYQREGISATSLYTTCRLVKRLFPVLPTLGSIITTGDMHYVVIQIVHSTAYASLLRIQSTTHSTRHPLPWPTVGWTIKVLVGADDNSTEIDYQICHVPRSLYMRREVYRIKTHMIFSDLKTKLIIHTSD